MDETAIAFEGLQRRAAAAALPLLDRISVRDYVRQVEIGAFASERGVAQRLRFNLVLEVCHHAAAESDDVDQVISYDSLTAAIDAELAGGRVNLLETLAERVARRCLADPRAVRVFVRAEKLDRVPGALGVEIVRSRVRGTAALRADARPAGRSGPRPAVVFLSRAALGSDWTRAAAALARPVVVAVEPDADQPRGTGEALFRAGLLAIDRAAWLLAAANPRFTVASSRAEIDWAVREGRPAVWAPSKLAADAVPRPEADASDPAGLAQWLAEAIGAERLVVVGDQAPERGGVPVVRLGPDEPARLAEAAER